MNPSEALFNSLFAFLIDPTNTVGVVWMVLKVLYVLGFLMYLLFAGIVVRQVYMMTKTYHTGAQTFLRIIAWLHFAVAVFVLLLAFLIL